MLNAQDKQFKLNETGEILFQPDASNPLPGQPVAKLCKGAVLLLPDVELTGADLPEGASEKLKTWLKTHIATVLEPLLPLMDDEAMAGSAAGVCHKLFQALGILSRGDLEAEIAALDDAGRAALRKRKVRLGPVLVFLPALNKPAAVRLRALLWNIWNGRVLPAVVPHDGATSVTVADPAAADPQYYRAIGYPLYGPRAIRVDMLDRLIAAVYDGAKDGKFRATHTMAEWLGCSIPDLYAVLEAMGNKKIEEEKPAEDVTATVTEETSVSETPVAPETKEDNSEQKTEQKKPAVKPDLALFQLRKGRAYDKPRAPRPPRTDAKPQQGPRPERKDRPQKKGGKPGRRPDDRGERKERVISAAAQTRGDSPFAALAALKAKGGDK